jgi:hypothetical protein
MNKQILFFRISGGANLFFMFFHCAFYKTFGWHQSLSCLSRFDRSIMLTYHYLIILTIGVMGIIPFLQAKIIINSPVKYILLSFFSVFYFIRIVAEFTLFGYSGVHSFVIIALCAIPIICNMVPMFYRPQDDRL